MLTREGDTNTSHRRQRGQDALALGEHEQALLERDAQVFFHQALSTPCLQGITGAQGSYLYKADGSKILDFHGNSAHQVGFGHPQVIEAITAQMAAMPFCTRRYTNAPSVKLAQRLVSLAPGSLRDNSRVLFAPGGAQAVSMAVHIAQAATGKKRVITFDGSFHGATLDIAPLGGERVADAAHGSCRTQVESVGLHVPPPFETSCRGCSAGVCNAGCVDSITALLRENNDIAAVLVEPVRATTLAAPPREYWAKVRAACDQAGALLIIDEIAVGLGRTGELFGCDAMGIEPDLVTIGKGLGGAIMPIAACIGRASLNEASDGAVRQRSVGHFTHEKSPVAAAAALAVLDIIERDGLAQRAQELGQWWAQKLREQFSNVEGVAEIRQYGLMLGIVLEGGHAHDIAEATMYGCMKRGLSFKIGGGRVLVLGPPLTVCEDELFEATDIIVDAYSEATSQVAAYNAAESGAPA